MVIRALLAIALVGCTYDSTLQDCHVACTTATGCPDGFMCGTEGLCRLEGAGDSCAMVLADGGIDSGSDAFVVMFTPSNLDSTANDLTAGTQDVVLGTATIDTDNGTITGVTVGGNGARVQIQASAPQLQVFRFKSLRIQGAVTVQGSRGLVIVAVTTITVTGSIQFTGQTACSSGTSGNGTSSGGGAGFGTGGGAGALGSSSTVPGGAGPVRGTPSLVPLVAGCRGAAGSSTASGTVLGGAGGGALQFVAGAHVDVSGLICVPGLGGAIGLDTTGSGGGGSGGAILLEAPTVDVASSATVAANGGGGGGSSGPFGADGQPGGFSCNGTAGGVGGAGDGTAGGGGNGGFGATVPQSGASGVVGTGTYAGGGGGAVGRIRINRTSGATNGGVSPPASSGALPL